MKIVHISDLHSIQNCEAITIPECDVLIYSGDIEWRTDIHQLMVFLTWFEAQPARKKILVPGNHDIVLDSDFVYRQKDSDTVLFNQLRQQHKDAIELITHYKIKYLHNKDYVFEGEKFYGSGFSPSYHRERWAFNADRGKEIRNHWGRIPSDVTVLITHTPVYNIFDDVKEAKKENEMDPRVGCQDLANVIKKRLTRLKLHCCGHIHNNYGVELKNISNKRRVMFSNGAMVDNSTTLIIKHPLIITI